MRHVLVLARIEDDSTAESWIPNGSLVCAFDSVNAEEFMVRVREARDLIAMMEAER